MFYAHSVLLDKDAVVVWGNSPVLRVIVLVWVVFLVVGEEIVKLYALFEILDGFEASNVLEEVEISIDVDASSDESMPVDALQLNVGVVLLELEVNSLTEVDVWSLDGMHILSSHFKLVEIEVFGEHLHIFISKFINKIIIKSKRK